MKKSEQWKKYVQKTYKVGSTALSLFVNRNQNFGVECCAGLSDGLKQIKNLKKLQIEIGSFNKIGVDGCNILGESLKHYNELQYLSLIFGEELDIKDQGIGDLLKDLNTSQSLINLELEFGDWNEIYEEGAKHIKVFVKKQVNLNVFKLKLEKSAITNGGLKFIGEAIQSLRQLNELSLNIEDSQCNLKGTQLLFNSIAQIKGLTKLSLKITIYESKNNKLKDKDIPDGIKQISELLNSLQELQRLELVLFKTYNMNGKSAQLLGESIKKQQKLKGLLLDISGFTQAGRNGMLEITEGIRFCRNLYAFSFYIDRFDPAILHYNEFNRRVKKNIRLVQYKRFTTQSYYDLTRFKV